MTEKNWYERELNEPNEITEADFKDEEPVREPSNVGQHTLLSYLIANSDIWALAEPIIKPDYFDNEYKPVIEFLMEFAREYKDMPSVQIIRSETGVLLDLYSDANKPSVVRWLLDEVQTFCRHRAAEIELRRATLAIQNGTTRPILEEILNNFKIINEINLEKDLGIEVHRDARVRLNTKQEQLTKPTGYRWLDRVSGGGMPCPGLLMLPGTPGLGKSNMLTNMLCNYANAGEFCVYVTLELSEQRIFERVCAIMTDTNIRDIYGKRDTVADQLEHVIRTQSGGLLYIKKMKMMGTTRSHLHAYLKELTMKEGRKPTVLGLDYIDLMYPMARIRDLSNIHIKDKYTSQEFYDLLEEWNLLGITPSQRVKNQADLDEWDMGGTAGGAPKNDIADYIIMIKRNDTEMFGYVQKGRYGGENSKLPFLWNVNTLKISDGHEEVFYQLNPRWDPNFARKEAEKNASAQQATLNRDRQNFTNELILDRIARSNPSVSDSFEAEPDVLTAPF